MRLVSLRAQVASAKAAIVASSVIFLAACDNPAPGEAVEHQLMEKPMPVVVSASEALQTPDITATDPGTMKEAEIRKVLPLGFQCSFAYTAESLPILAGVLLSDGKTAQGVIKIHGRLVEIIAQDVASKSELVDGAVFAADGLKLEVRPDPLEDVSESVMHRRPADLVFELEQGLHVGYRGWYECGTQS